MKLSIKLFGILMVLIGISLLIKPDILIGWIENNMETTPLYISAIVVRLIFGILFLAAARESRYPGVLKFLGYLFIIAAIIFIFIGQDNFIDFISSIIPNVKPYAPVSGLLAMVFGGFLVYAFSSNKELEEK